MKKRLLVTALTSLLGLSGCKTTGLDLSQLDLDDSSYPVVVEQSIDTDLVEYRFVQGKNRQTKNKVSVTLEPISIEQGEILHRIELEPMFTLLTVNGRENYKATYTPVIRQDDRLQFTLKVANASSRVLRPSGAVLTFNVDGKSTSVKQGNYEQLVNVMIVPNNSEEITVQGPKLSELKKDKGILAIDIYEVKVGDHLSSYSWVLEYEKLPTTIETIVKTDKITATPSEATKINGNLVKL